MVCRRFRLWFAIVAIGLAAHARAAEPPVDFSRQIQPLLSDRCYKCHGPDAAQRQAGLRLDQREDALAAREGVRAIVPGDASASALVERIFSEDVDEQMPPPDSKLTLSPAEKALLRRWVAEGAKWTEHWAFVAPQRAKLSAVKQADWPRNAIDYFVLQKLEAEKLSPSPQADRRTLIRRVTLDLTGLPPTPEEVAAFIGDERPDAYERLVDRLLASPRYGERMALPWLDAARYADTSGYQTDGPRHMWRWRDWVIEALNANMPFDQFTIEQLAGDLLPNATLEQRIATGFNRNHRGNAEGGIIAAEYEAEYVVDRVDTTATVWLGLTLGCARCHDHKYDPFTHQEFYQLFAYFNNIPEHGRAIKEGNSPPYITAPTRVQWDQLAQLKMQLAEADAQLAAAGAKIEAAQAQWETDIKPANLPDWNFDESQTLHLALDEITQLLVAADGKPEAVAGRIGKALNFDGRTSLEAGDVANFGYFDKFSIACWVRPGDAPSGMLISRTVDAPEGEGYSVLLREGRLHVLLVKRWLDDAIRVETAEAVIVPDRWQHLAVTYDGSRAASGIRVYVDGEPQPLKVNLDSINQTFAAAKEPLRIGSGGGPTARFRGALDDVRIYGAALEEGHVRLLATAGRLAEIVEIPAEKRSEAQANKLSSYFYTHALPDDLQPLYATAKRLREQHQALVEKLPSVMVMQELETPRPAHVLVRGQYDRLGKQVERGVPQALPPLAKEASNDRLGLARWIVDPANPLTARVALNRQWQLFFGTGLVRTTEDFGTQGERPSHPELLDWLASEFASSGWNVKELQRRIVTSSTYRQSSRVSPELARLDPENLLLARGARFRLAAHTVRDQALLASGLLVEETGGPSVKPYQPPGLWEELAGAAQKYEMGHGADLYRRSLYTYWKRTAAPPSLMTFDAADRETCVVRRTRTNTPLQALALMNEITFVEAARMLAERALRESPEGDAPLVRMFQLATSRPPADEELKILRASRDHYRAGFAEHPDEAEKLLAIGEFPSTADIDPITLAANAAVANLILNLDEVVTRE